jgi:hypothetical protein
MLMEPSILAVNFGLRDLELLLRQLEFLFAVVGFFSLLLERGAHERSEPEQVEKQDVLAARRVVVSVCDIGTILRPSGPVDNVLWRKPTSE